ncbi:MAG: tRNA dihydrouridine(20/20a) synthase DusA, partial [Alphaproteobacteria bacterium]|nr:tRNA dihydrouridine(20/20a) synthase DusA [Alphaproteobacteria bacterium]
MTARRAHPAASRLAVAPMMDWTDRHFRYVLRQASRRTRLYTEMVTAAALRQGDRDRLLGFHPAELPLTLQLGGSDPALLAEAARIGAGYGYDEINLNVGCPSDRVQAGRFGACLMAEPDLVARCVAAMAAAVPVPVTVKCRLAIDDMPEWETLAAFVGRVADAGCGHVIVHARKAWLAGLSPRQNREVPPLHPELVWRLKAAFPHLAVTLNGGIRSLDEAERHIAHVDGVMMGRAVCDDPWLLAAADLRFWGEAGAPADRHELLVRVLPYVWQQLAMRMPLMPLAKPLIGLFNGLPGGRAWRRRLSESAPAFSGTPDEAIRLLVDAATLVSG